MSCTVTLRGSVSVNGNGCAVSTTGTTPSTKTMGLSLSCPGTVYGAVVSTDCPTQISTSGSIGDNFIELPGSDAIDKFQLVSLKSTSAIILRIGAAPATLLGVGGSFPTGFSGGEAFSFSVDGVTIAGTFTAAAQSISDVVNELNQAAVGAAFTFLPFVADVSGQISVTGLLTGGAGSVVVNTANATIGFAVAPLTALGAGEDIGVNGSFLVQFSSTGEPSRIQISGSAQVEVLSAGTSATS